MSEKHAFATQMNNALMDVVPLLKYLPRCIVTSHAILESGWGQSDVAKKANNVFNITRLPSSPLPIFLAGDTEHQADGKIINITQRFAAYPTLVDGVMDYLQFIQRKRYTDAYDKLIRGDMVGYIKTLRKGGYFTAPLIPYIEAMSSILGAVCDIVVT